MTPSVPLVDLPTPRIATAGKLDLVLKSSQFRKGREQGWLDLERLVALVERKGVRSLTDELQRLPILTRRAVVLSVAHHRLDRNLLLYLENLAGAFSPCRPRVRATVCANSSVAICRSRARHVAHLDCTGHAGRHRGRINAHAAG